MTDDTNIYKPQHRLAAKLVSLAEQGNHKAQGPAPNDEELALLFDDQLDFKRKNEVISHLNTNPALREQWLQLVEVASMNTRAQTSPSIAKSGWLAWLANLRPAWPRLVAGMAVAGIAAVMIITQTQQGIAPQQDSADSVADGKNTPANTGPAFVSPDKRAMAAGILATLNTSTDSLPYKLNLNHAVDTEGSALKADLYQDYVAFGAALTELAIQCHPQPAIDQNKLKKWLQLRDTLNTTSFLKINSNLMTLTTDSPATQVCPVLDSFLQSNF